MLPIGAVIVDFDGTVCLHDVGVDLLDRFGADVSRNGELAGIDEAFDAGRSASATCWSRRPPRSARRMTS